MDRNQLLNDTETAIRYGLDGLQTRLWTAMPAIVESVNFESMTISAQPAIQGLVTLPSGETQYVNLPLLLDVPICFPSAGGFALTLPIAAGDEVLIVFSSRCIDSWWQNGNISVPMELRMHDLSDGFAIPGPCSSPKTIPNISASNVQLRNKSGSVYLEITPSGHINIVATSGLNITGDVVVTGEVTANGIPLSTHIHSGVTSGTSNSGGPLP